MSYEVMVGNKAAATAVKLAKVQVASALPITPQTTIVQYLADMMASGELDAEYVTMEGELSCQASAITASTTVRSFTATSGPGLLYMHHPMHMTSWARLPMRSGNWSRIPPTPPLFAMWKKPSAHCLSAWQTIPST